MSGGRIAGGRDAENLSKPYIMKKYLLLCLSAGLFLFAGCNGEQPADAETQEEDAGMEQFAEDEAFQAAHKTPNELEFQGRGEMVSLETPDGLTANAYLLPADAETNQYLLVFHEWWGLNEHIKAEAERLFDMLDSNVTVLALDLYDGQVAATQERASELMQSVDQAQAEAIIQSAIERAGAGAQIGTIGWCFGGGWSLRAAIMAGEQGAGCVMYYGMPVQSEEAIEPLSCDVLGLFAEQDDWITDEVIRNFKQLAETADKELEVYTFDALHAFANPSNPHFDERAAEQANELAWTFLKERL